MSGKIEVHAGDFEIGKESFFKKGFLYMKRKGQAGHDVICVTRNTVQLEVASEEAKKRFGWAFVAGFAGGFLLGPAGLLAGALAGGQRKQVTFIAQFHGRKCLATTDSRTYTQMVARIF